MRIAISGTHCCGKSTLIDAFLFAHTDFAHEPEPYAVLQEDYGECFAAEPAADDFYRQLEFNLERLRLYPHGQRVIYERCPGDFLAYLLALHDVRGNADALRLAEESLGRVADAMQFLDLIVFLPLQDGGIIVAPDAEDLELRDAVDQRLAGIFGGEFDLFAAHRPMILEATGSTARRLLMIQKAIDLPAEQRAGG